MSHIHLPGPLCYISIKIKWLSQYWKSWDLGAGPLHVFGNWAWKMCPSLADPKNRIYDLWGQRPSSCSSLNWFSGNWSRNILGAIDTHMFLMSGPALPCPHCLPPTASFLAVQQESSFLICLGSNPNSTRHWLCDLKPVTALPPRTTWGWEQNLHEVTFMH